MTDIKIWITVATEEPAVYYRGLSDYECDDPLGSPEDVYPIYCQEGFYPRNYPSRPSVPEVMRMENGDTNRLTEFWEWVWFWSWKIYLPSMTMEEALEVHKKYTRTNAFATNKNGWDDGKHSWVLGLNPTAEAMRIEGTITPGLNIFRGAGEANENLVPIWCLDFTKPPDFSGDVSEAARAFAIRLPLWIVHVARIVHPEQIGAPTVDAPNGVFRVTSFDSDFTCPPLLTSVGRQAVVDGFNCRVNYVRAVRLKRI